MIPLRDTSHENGVLPLPALIQEAGGPLGYTTAVTSVGICWNLSHVIVCARFFGKLNKTSDLCWSWWGLIFVASTEQKGHWVAPWSGCSGAPHLWSWEQADPQDLLPVEWNPKHLVQRQGGRRTYFTCRPTSSAACGLSPAPQPGCSLLPVKSFNPQALGLGLLFSVYRTVLASYFQMASLNPPADWQEIGELNLWRQTSKE